MSLVVESPGLFSTVQDLGRFGAREWGVPIGGAFDLGSFSTANALLDNPSNSAAVELTSVGGAYLAKSSMAIALAGASMEARIDRSDGSIQSFEIPRCLTLKPGDRLVLGPAERGLRTYLAVKGGWKTSVVLGSRSSEKPLKRGDVLPIEQPSTAPEIGIKPGISCRPDPQSGPIRIVDGPDAARLMDQAEAWNGLVFFVGIKSDRMGLRLEGSPPEFVLEPDKLSAPVAPGAIQGTGSGLILLGVACGTLGGYPHLAQVISMDMDRLAQARPGDRLTFERVSIDEARRLDRADRADRRRWVEHLSEMSRLSRRSSSIL